MEELADLYKKSESALKEEEAKNYNYDDYYDEEDPYGQEVQNPKVVSHKKRTPG